MSTELARFQRYRLDMECDCGATFFGLVEAGDQWHADHMNEHCTREHPHRLIRNVMLPPVELRPVVHDGHPSDRTCLCDDCIDKVQGFARQSAAEHPSDETARLHRFMDLIGASRDDR